jgi:ABC-2 type transport system permease protein
MWFLVKKEILHIIRDKGLLIFIIYAFTLDIILAAKGFRLIPEHVSIAVLDEDNSVKSRLLVDRIKPPAFKKPLFLENRKEIDPLMNRSDVVLTVVIPSGFERSLERDGGDIQILVDGTQSTAAYLSSSYLQRIVNSYSMDLLKERAWREGLYLDVPLELRSRVLFNPSARDDLYEGLNEFFMIITLIGMILPAALLIREREYGTIEQIMISPLSVGRLIVVKILGSQIFLQSVIALSFVFILRMWLKFPLKTGVFVFIFISLLYSISTTGLAFIIASVAKRFSQVGMLTIVIFAPMLLLSGGWVPPEALPKWLRAATHISPLKQFMDLGISLLIRGASVETLSWGIIKLLLIGGVLLTTGVLLYRRQTLTR